jgi:predicted nucleic acid-binding protein
LAEGLPVIGTLGLLIRAVRDGIMTRPDALRAVDELIRDLAMRISVDLYQEILRQLQ